MHKLYSTYYNGVSVSESAKFEQSNLYDGVAAVGNASGVFKVTSR